MKQLQFELWQECGANCIFCFLGSANKFTPDDLKIKSLQNTTDKISDLSIYSEYDTLSYIGGEFFQGQMKNPEVRSKFMELMKKTAWLKDNGYIKNIWLYATLTIGDQKDLYETLELFDNKENFWILTSYDTMGRFHTKKMEDTWKYHMKHIHELYPEIKFNITTILTGDLIEKYLKNEFSFQDMSNEFNCEFFIKQPYISGFKTREEMNEKVGNFFPTRQELLKFLIKFKENESELYWKKLFNINYRADDLYKNYNDPDNQMVLQHRNKEKNFEEDIKTTGIRECGHMDSFEIYVDSDDCALCDKEKIDMSYN